MVQSLGRSNPKRSIWSERKRFQRHHQHQQQRERIGSASPVLNGQRDAVSGHHGDVRNERNEQIHTFPLQLPSKRVDVEESYSGRGLPTGRSVYDMMANDDHKEMAGMDQMERFPFYNAVRTDSATTALRSDREYEQLESHKSHRSDHEHLTVRHRRMGTDGAVNEVLNMMGSTSTECNNIISNDQSAYIKNDDHFVSISNESYLSEVFLKQPIVIKLKYITIGPLGRTEWTNDAIHWKIEIVMKRDFDYLDEFKIYRLTAYEVDRFHPQTIRFTATQNLHGGRTSLALNGNICIKLFQCNMDDGVVRDQWVDDEVGDFEVKLIGTIWIHSHFIPANYERTVHTMRFGKDEVDGMYKDRNNKGPIPPDFCVEIGYRCSRIKKKAAK